MGETAQLWLGETTTQALKSVMSRRGWGWSTSRLGLRVSRSTHRSKDGKDHRYYSLVESVRTSRGPQHRTLAYLGELNGSTGVGVAQVG